MGEFEIKMKHNDLLWLFWLPTDNKERYNSVVVIHYQALHDNSIIGKVKNCEVAKVELEIKQLIIFIGNLLYIIFII